MGHRNITRSITPSISFVALSSALSHIYYRYGLATRFDGMRGLYGMGYSQNTSVIFSSAIPFPLPPT